MILTGKPYLPERKKLETYIDRIYDQCWLTNDGFLLRELTDRLSSYFGVSNILLVTNGTFALQIAYRALGLDGTVLTSPFSFAATTTSLEWEGIHPKYVDIDSETFCMDTRLLEKAIDSETTGAVPVHVYGNPCDIEGIQAIAEKNRLKVVYDAAHAFGVRIDDRSILCAGDASVLSFHATKLYHTIEGGAIVFRDAQVLERAKGMINFGMNSEKNLGGPGTNAKMNEFQAAMGLAVLDDIDLIMERRSEIWHRYESRLKDSFQLQRRNPNGTNNYAYFPVVFQDEEALLSTDKKLTSHGVISRRYFHPSLDTVYGDNQIMPVSRSIAGRVLCLPVYADLTDGQVEVVCDLLLFSDD